MNKSLFRHSATPNIPEKLFRSYCATGLAVSRHLQDLRGATDVQTLDSAAPVLPWRKVLDNLDLSVIADSELWSVGEASLLSIVEAARKSLQAVAERYKAIGSQADLGEVLLEIATDIAPKTCEELRAEFHDVNLRSHALAGECIQRYGGLHAKTRWAKCSVASLRFTQRLDLTGFVPISDRFRNEIDIHVGTAPFALKSYLTLEYQLFHEYLSHLFPIWDSVAGMFSEGDMAALERWIYPRLAPSGLQVLILNAREREVIVASGNRGRDWANHQEEMADEVRLRWISEENLTRLLLEMASSPEEDLPFSVRNSLLQQLHYLPRVAHKWPKKKQIEVEDVLRNVCNPLDLEESLRKHCFPQNLLVDRTG